MKIRKKIVAFLAVCLCFATSLSLFGGCFVKAKKPLDEEMEAVLKNVDFNAGLNYKGKLNILVVDMQDHWDVINAFVDDFKQKYAGIEVTVKGSDSLVSQVITDHGAATLTGKYGDMPDVIWIANEDIPQMVNADAVMPIDYFDAADENWDTNKLVPAMVKDCYFDEHMYMMPRDYNQIAMLYNKKMFALAKQEGYNVKSPDEFKDADGNIRAMNREEFTQVAKEMNKWMLETKLKNSNDASYNSGSAVELKGSWLSLMSGIAANFGADLIGESGTATLTSDATVEMFKYLVEMVYNGVFYANSQNGYDKFAAEQAAMCFESRACLTAVTTKNNARNGVYADLAAAPMPCLGNEDNYVVGTGCSGYAMYRKAQHPTEAWLFLKNLVKEDAQNAFCGSGNGVPVLSSLLNDSEAVWRNIKTENPTKFGNLDENFCHDAFVYRTDRAATIGLKNNVPFKAYAKVCQSMSSVFLQLMDNSVVANGDPTSESTVQNIKNKLRGFRNDINNLIKANS